MRRILFVVFILFSISNVNAQLTLVDTIILSATNGPYCILADDNTQGFRGLYMEWKGIDTNFCVMSKMTYAEIVYFLNSLQNAKDKYLQWKRTALSLDTRSFTKRMPVSWAAQTIFFTRGENERWYHEVGVNIWSNFSVSSNGSCYLIIQTDYMTSEEVVAEQSFNGSVSNWSTGGWGLTHNSGKTTVTRRCEGATLTFSSDEEIDRFIVKLSQAMKWKKENQKQSRLFR